MRDVVYRDTSMSDLLNPVDIDPFYSAPTGASVPDFAGILIDGAVSTHSLSGAQEVVEGYDATDPTVLTLRNVHLDATSTLAQYARITECGANLDFSGEGVEVSAGS